MASRALIALALVAMVAAAAAQEPRWCHISCYNTGNCKAALAVKVSLLKSSGIPYTVDKTGCNKNDCGAIMLYSFATEEEYNNYQKAEKTGVLFARYTAAGLKSATPTGLAKNGRCNVIKVWA